MLFFNALLIRMRIYVYCAYNTDYFCLILGRCLCSRWIHWGRSNSRTLVPWEVGFIFQLTSYNACHGRDGCISYEFGHQW